MAKKAKTSDIKVPAPKKVKVIKKRRYYMRGNPLKKLEKVAKRGIPYMHVHTNRTTKIVVENETWLYGGKDYTNKEFNLIKKLKKEIHENIIAKNLVVPELTQNDVTYYEYSDRVKALESNSTFIDMDEYDISKAYYETAYYIGYMSKEMYDQCITLPKHIRLRFIGMIATFKRSYKKIGWQIVDYNPIKDDLLRRVWFHICKHVDDCMKEFKSMVGDKFLLYYVDGIYVKKGDYEEDANGNIVKRIVYDYKPYLQHLNTKYGLTFKKEKTYGMRTSIGQHSNSFGLTINKFDNKPTRKLTYDGHSFDVTKELIKIREKELTFPKEQEHRSEEWKNDMERYELIQEIRKMSSTKLAKKNKNLI